MLRRAGLEFTLNEMVVLSLLCEREMYGLQIVKAAAARTSVSQATPGSIYPLLKDLVREGWLSCRRTSGSPRVYYGLTEYGRQHLSLVAARLGEVTDSVRDLLGSVQIPAPASANETARPVPAQKPASPG
jgi:PadR family transcriptional regulator PadR